MTSCLITLKPLTDDESLSGYSRAGLRQLTGSTKVSMTLPFTRVAFFTEQPLRQQGMSISGYQPKLSLCIREGQFTVTDTDGYYLLKPSPEQYPYLAENEHATMTVMRRLGFDVPACGLVSFMCTPVHPIQEYAFLIQRYDRNVKTKARIQQEQLDGAMKIEDKYGVQSGEQAVSYSMIGRFISQVVPGVRTKITYFRQVIYAYLLGNNDLHLRNFSILRPETAPDELAPVYDFVTTAPYPSTFHSAYLALPLLDDEINGGLAPGFNSVYGQYIGLDFVLFGQSIGLNEKLIRKIITGINQDAEIVRETYKTSYMPSEHIESVLQCFNQRMNLINVLTI